MEKELKIRIDQLKNYLGTGLKIRIMDFKCDYVGKEIDELIGFHQWDKACKYWSALTIGGSKPNIDRIQPICYRLQDLEKLIPELGFVPIEELQKELLGHWCDHYDDYFNQCMPLDDLSQAPFEIAQILLKWHFWGFGDDYFEAGLVIDKLKQDAK